MPADFTSRVVSIEQMGRLTRGIAQTFGFTTLGGAVTVNAGMVLNVAAVSASTYIINGTVVTSAYSAATVTITTADATNPRLDIVWINSSGVVAVAAGTPAATPVPPTIGATGLELAMVLVGAGVTSIGAGDIIDRRQLILPSGMTLVGSDTTERTMTSATAADLSTVTGLSIPATTPVMIIVNYRKSAAAFQPGIGLKVNATVVEEAQLSTVGVGGFDATNEVQNGVSVMYLAPRRTNYDRGLVGTYSTTGASGFQTAALPTTTINAAIPIATITDIIIRGDSDGTNTLGVQGVYVYTLVV